MLEAFEQGFAWLAEIFNYFKELYELIVAQF